MKSLFSVSATEEGELALLVAQAKEAILKMRASIDRMIVTLDKSHRETDAFLRQMGIRQ